MKTEYQAADLSNCERYRWHLERIFDYAKGTIAFIGVNPSTADALIEDATTRKWAHFTLREGFGGYRAVNLFAYRATDVKELGRAEDAIGDHNDHFIGLALSHADLIVPCWGSRDKLPRPMRSRINRVIDLIEWRDKPVKVFGLTNAGDPKHPLFLGHDHPLIEVHPSTLRI